METNNEHFLKWITVEEFKCFSNFHAEGFKRVNLIGGRNNVGKTAFMEALFINAHSIDIDAMAAAMVKIKFTREAINILERSVIHNKFDFIESIGICDISSNIGKSSFRINFTNGSNWYTFKTHGEESPTNLNRRLFDFNDSPISRVTYIGLHSLSKNDICDAFDFVQTMEGELYLNELINNFDSSIDGFKVIGGKPRCKSNGSYRDLTDFGDGLNSYIGMICSMYSSQNGYLFIDEIDNGIYYEHFDRLWEIILKLSKEMNCQVFATTHSKEMLESFARVAKKLQEEDVSYTLLLKNKKQELKAITIDYKNIVESILSQGVEIR